MSITINQSNHAKISYYGNTNNYKVLIVCPHACLGTEFINKYPQIQKATYLNTQQMHRYLAIEQDFGTEELGNKIASICSDKFKIDTILIQPLFPRSIIDAGRVYPFNLRNITNYDCHKDLKKMLLKMHSSYIKELQSYLKKIKKSNGFVIDLHTMSTYSPVSRTEGETYSEALIETPESLLNYIQSYETCHIFGRPRHIEIFTGDWKRKITAHYPLLMSIYEQLLLSDYPIEFDKPYIAAPHLIGSYLMEKTKAVCIDIPKDLISKYTTQDSEYNLAKLHLDMEKLTRLAHTISQGVANTVQGDQT